MKLNKIFIAIPSRYPDSFRISVDLLFSKISSTKVETVVVFNEGSRPEYEDIISEYPSIRFVEHGHSLREAYNKLFEMFFESDCYFFFYPTDDMVSIPDRIDENITNAYKRFSDDIFIISSLSTARGREVPIIQANYIIEPNFCLKHIYRRCEEDYRTKAFGDLPYDFVVCYRYGDMMPVITYKVAEYIDRFFRSDKNPIGLDIFVNYFIQQLQLITGQNRNLLLIPPGLECIDQQHTDKILRRAQFDFNFAQALVAEMAERIISVESI